MASNTSITPTLLHSAPFINCHWRTNIFSVSTGSPSKSIKVAVADRTAGDHIPRPIKEICSRLAGIADDLIAMVALEPVIQKELGLTDEPSPNHGYPQSSNRLRFFKPFMACVLLDKCLWTIEFKDHLSMETVQLRHPASIQLPDLASKIAPMDCKGPIIDFIVSCGSHQGFKLVEQPSASLAQTANLTVASATSSSKSEVHRITGHIFYLAACFQALSFVRIISHHTENIACSPASYRTTIRSTFRSTFRTWLT
jgi:hypothetical protein